MNDTYVPRRNREAVKFHGEIFEKFNEKNQLSRRGEWGPRQNKRSKQNDQFEEFLGNIDIANIYPTHERENDG